MIREDVNQASNEITSEVSPGYNCSYTYDANENRLTKTLNGVADSYNYDNGDKLTSITSGGTMIQSFGYDAAGRTTSITTSSGTTNLSYDYESRLTSITYPGGGFYLLCLQRVGHKGWENEFVWIEYLSSAWGFGHRSGSLSQGSSTRGSSSLFVAKINAFLLAPMVTLGFCSSCSRSKSVKLNKYGIHQFRSNRPQSEQVVSWHDELWSSNLRTRQSCDYGQSP